MANLNIDWNKATPQMSVTLYVSRRWLFRLWLAGRLLTLAKWVYPGQMSLSLDHASEHES